MVFKLKVCFLFENLSDAAEDVLYKDVKVLMNQFFFFTNTTAHTRRKHSPYVLSYNDLLNIQ